MSNERKIGGGGGESEHTPRKSKKFTKTWPLGLLAGEDPHHPESPIPMPDLPQKSIETGSQIAQQVQAVSQVLEQAQSEKPANYRQYLEALGFAKVLNLNISQEELKKWVDREIIIQPDGTVQLTHLSSNIDASPSHIQLPQSLVVSESITIWGPQGGVKFGQKFHVMNNLAIMGDPGLDFSGCTDFYVNGSVICTKLTPEDTVKALEYYKAQGRIRGELVQR